MMTPRLAAIIARQRVHLAARLDQAETTGTIAEQWAAEDAWHQFITRIPALYGIQSCFLLHAARANGDI